MHEGGVGAARELVVEGETHEVGVAEFLKEEGTLAVRGYLS